MTRYPNQLDDRHNLRRQRNRRTSEQLAHQNRHRVEVIQRDGSGTGRDPVVVVSGAVRPEPDLVKVVQAEGAREGVEEREGGRGAGGEGGGQNISEGEAVKVGFREEGGGC